MTDPTTEFFEALRERGHEPRLRQAKGTFRFELTKARKIDRWLVTLNRGDVTVLHRGGDADCIVRADRAVFDRLASGELNGVAAVLRGELVAEGNWKLLVLFQRLFPGKPPSPAKRSRAGYSRRHA
jgi:putative sterol carrier protein